MHGSLASINKLVSGLKNELADVDGVDIAVCPPLVYIPQVAAELGASAIAWGAQTLNEYPEGAFTGEVSAGMLADLGCSYVLVGHSERRALYGETDQLVAAKYVAAQSAGLKPILCVGETLLQRDSGDALAVVESQVRAVIERAGVESLTGAVLAYEPVWAIGTGKTASPEQAQQVHEFIRQLLAASNQVVAESVQLLYGGSVNANNAEALFAKDDIDGALVGGASLKVAEFAAICRAA